MDAMGLNVSKRHNVSEMEQNLRSTPPLVCLKDKIHMSNEKRAPGCLGYIGDDELPSYMGITS